MNIDDYLNNLQQNLDNQLSRFGLNGQLIGKATDELLQKQKESRIIRI